MMEATVAIVQGRAYGRGETRAYVDDAMNFIGEAASRGAHLLVYPQGYPGAYLTGALAEETLAATREQARRHGMVIVYGGLEPDGKGKYHITAQIIDTRGEVVYTYARSSPRGPFYYGTFHVDYVGADEPPAVIEVDGMRIGIVMCGEIFVPELSRLLGLDGADLIVNPACTVGPGRVPAWRTVAAARGIENLSYVAACQQLGHKGGGIGLIAGPSGPIAEANGIGVTTAALGLKLVRSLHFDTGADAARRRRDVFGGALFYRRPELCAALAR